MSHWNSSFLITVGTLKPNLFLLSLLREHSFLPSNTWCGAESSWGSVRSCHCSRISLRMGRTGAVYYLSDMNLGSTVFDKLMTQWREPRSDLNPWRYHFMLSPFTSPDRSTISTLLFPVSTCTEGIWWTLGNPNPSYGFTLSAFRTVAPSNFSLGVWGEVFPLYPSPTSMIPWKQNTRRCFLNDSDDSIRSLFLPWLPGN